MTPTAQIVRPVKPVAVLVTPDKAFRDRLIELLAERITVQVFSTHEEASNAAVAPETDLVIVDESCGPEEDGLTFLMHIREKCPEKGTMLIAANLTAGVHGRAEAIGVNRIIVPPVTLAVVAVVGNALKYRRLYLQNENNEAVIARLRTENLEFATKEESLMGRLSAAETALAAAEARNPPASQP